MRGEKSSSALGDAVWTTAAADGTYSFTGMPPGNYEVEVSFAGFTPYRESNLDIASDAPLHFDIQLALASQTEVVEVISDPGRPELEPSRPFNARQRLDPFPAGEICGSLVSNS